MNVRQEGNQESIHLNLRIFDISSNPKDFTDHCRSIADYNPEERNGIYRILAQQIENNPTIVEESKETKRSPLEDLIDAGGDIAYLMSLVSLDNREDLTYEYIDLYSPCVYEELDKGNFILMLSVPTFWENVIDNCIDKKEKISSSNNVFPFLFNATMRAFSYYINDWLVSYLNDPEEERNTLVFNKILSALNEFTPHQQKAFLDDLEKDVYQFVTACYKKTHEDILQRRLSELIEQCGKLFKQANIKPSLREIHNFTVEDLKKTAQNGNLTPNQRLTALNRFAKTKTFKKLAVEERVVFFRDICSAASTQAGTIRKLMLDLQQELVWNEQSLQETTISLNNMQAKLFDLIQKTQDEALKHLPENHSYDRILHEKVDEAKKLKPQWEALYQGLQKHFGNEMDKLKSLDIDIDDLFTYVFTGKKCNANEDDVAKLFIDLNISTLEQLESALKNVPDHWVQF